jgi:glycosyltransferase involved in cell wall biosynthesis
MTLLALAILAALVTTLSWGRQAVWSLRLALNFPPRRAPADPPDDAWPFVTVCVPLRGSDPVLGEMLRGLCRQEYPRYEIRIVVDSAADPAWGVVRQVIGEFPHVRITTSVLTERLDTCSLKVSALLQAFRDLDWQTGVVALIDADVLPPPHWLRELVRPFDDPKVGATTGLRWYHTDSRAWGSLVRGLWGAGAAAQMYSLDILWGGTLAFRASLVRDPGLREVWATSFVEDTSAVGYLRDRGYRMEVLPRLTMINPEATTLSGCYRFLRRQMVCMRLHHPAWRNILLTTVAMAAAAPLSAMAAMAAFWWGADWLAWTVLGVLIAGVLGAGLPLVYIDWYFWYTAPKDKPLSTLHPKHVPVVPLTIFVHLAAVLAACRVREVDWRGIRYAVEPGNRVRRLNDAPYLEAPAGSANSIV